jgi:hypothetical protein
MLDILLSANIIINIVICYHAIHKISNDDIISVSFEYMYLAAVVVRIVVKVVMLVMNRQHKLQQQLLQCVSI